MGVYHLTFQYRSNEYPWSGTHQGHGIETDEAAQKWASYFLDQIGDAYQITLFKNGVVMPFGEADERAGRCEACDGTGCTVCQSEGCNLCDDPECDGDHPG